MSDDGQINNTDCLTLSNNLPDQVSSVNIFYRHKP